MSEIDPNLTDYNLEYEAIEPPAATVMPVVMDGKVAYGGDGTVPATPPAGATTIQLALANAAQQILTNTLATGSPDMDMREVINQLAEDLRASAMTNPKRFANDLQRHAGELQRAVGAAVAPEPSAFADGIPANPAGARMAAFGGAPRAPRAPAKAPPPAPRAAPQKPDPARIVRLSAQILAEKLRQDFQEYAHLIELTNTIRLDEEGRPLCSGEITIELTEEREVEQDDGTIVVETSPTMRPLAAWNEVAIEDLPDVYASAVAVGVQQVSEILASVEDGE